MRKLACLAVALLLDAPAQAGEVAWRPIQPGVEHAAVDLGTHDPAGDNKLQVVRIDPRRATLQFSLASEGDRRPLTVKAWCTKSGLSVAINAGMFRDDHVSNVGHLVDGAHVNSGRWVPSYQSALAFAPRDPNLPAAIMVDLDEPGAKEQLAGYRAVVQNLRLIKAQGGKGRSVWKAQPRRWSEAAVAIDDKGRVLFLFSRTPFAMAEFNRLVLSLPLGVVRAMHVEGGPEASLSIHGGGVDLDWFGSFETGFLGDDSNPVAWPIPNVLGVSSAAPPAAP